MIRNQAIEFIVNNSDFSIIAGMNDHEIVLTKGHTKNKKMVRVSLSLSDDNTIEARLRSAEKEYKCLT